MRGAERSEAEKRKQRSEAKRRGNWLRKIS